MADFTFDDGGTEEPVLGSPEGDGDFETDGLAETGVTSAGGQVNTGEAERRKSASSRVDVPGPQQPVALDKAIEEAGQGKDRP